MSESDRPKSYSVAQDSALEVRRRFISLTYELPVDGSQKVVQTWAAADDAIVRFIRALEEAKRSTQLGKSEAPTAPVRCGA